MRTEEKDKKDQTAFLLLLFGVILVLGALLLFQMQDNTNEGSDMPFGNNKNIRTKDFEKKVNYHLADTYSKSQLKEKITEYQNKKEAPQISKTAEETPYPYNGEVNLDGENWGELVGKDLKGIHRERQYDTPEQKVRDELLRDQQMEAQRLADQEAYAQQFIENARKDGYEITLDSQYRIIDVKKIKKPRYPSLFNEGDADFGTGASR